jgi:hypothetical protein
VIVKGGIGAESSSTNSLLNSSSSPPYFSFSAANISTFSSLAEVKGRFLSSPSFVLVLVFSFASNFYDIYEISSYFSFDFDYF